MKSKQLLVVAAAHGCTVSINSLSELNLLAEVHAQARLKVPCNVFLRLSGFSLSEGSAKGNASAPGDSRFGIPVRDWAGTLQALSCSTLRERIKVTGIAFHLDNHSLPDRVTALLSVLERGLEARRHGHPFAWIDIGGGLPCQYISSQVWTAFAESYSGSPGDNTGLAFRNRSFGIKPSDHGFDSGCLYPHGGVLFKDAFLSALISSKDANGVRISDRLRCNDIGLIIEPGRSLLDQSGFTVCHVKTVKTSALGIPLVCVNMNISHMWDQVIGSEFTVDPILLPRSGDRASQGQSGFEGHVVGNLCLESDVLTWRKVYFPQTPRQGDLLVFPNTAGYQMDFIESQIHRLPLPRRVTIFEGPNGWTWKLDGEFSVFDILSS